MLPDVQRLSLVPDGGLYDRILVRSHCIVVQPQFALHSKHWDVGSAKQRLDHVIRQQSRAAAHMHVLRLAQQLVMTQEIYAGNKVTMPRKLIY
jgi:hypothetical protein